MLRAGVGHSANPITENAAQEAASRAMSQAGLDRADLAVVFFTVDHLEDYPKLLANIFHIVGTDRVVGCSGAGVLTGETEIEGSPGLAVLVLSADRIRMEPHLSQPLHERDREIAKEIAQRAAGRPGENSLLVLFPDPYHARPDRLCAGIEEELGFLPIVGAGCSENGSQGRTFQLCGEELVSNAVAGATLSGSFQAAIDTTQGCQPVSEPMVITKAKDNLIFEINHEPAFEAFARVIKGPLLENLRRALAFVFAGLPADPEKNSVAPGDYLVRNIVGLDSQKGILAVADSVHEGESILFTLREGQRAREDLDEMLKRQVTNLEGKKPAFGFYFNCCARGGSLYGISGIDTTYIRRWLGDFPLIGFFGNFELGPLGRRNRLLAYTGVLALITEDDK